MGDKVALRALEAVMTRERGVNRIVLLGGQGQVSAESLPGGARNQDQKI